MNPETGTVSPLYTDDFYSKIFLNMQKQILEIRLDISFEFFKIMLIAESDRHYQIPSSIVDDI